MTVLSCMACDKPYIKRGYHKSRGFCSSPECQYACKNVGKKCGIRIANCRNCGQPFVRPSHQPPSFYCGRKCSAQMRTRPVREATEKRCSKCGATKLRRFFPVAEKGPKGGAGGSICRPCLYQSNYMWRIKKTYGVTRERFEEMWAQQGGKCPVCLRDLARTSTSRHARVNVDHDHGCCAGATSCGQCVCGLLCGRCNSTIGLLGDDPSVLERAALYLRRTRRHVMSVAS